MPQSARGWSPLPGRSNPPPAGDLYWVILEGTNTCKILPNLSPGGFDPTGLLPYRVLGGPIPLAQAQAIVAQYCGAGQQPPPPPPPSGPPQPGGGLPNNGGTETGGGFFVRCWPDGSTTVFDAPDLATAQQGFPGSVIAGPFAFDTEASDWVKANPDACKKGKPAPCDVKPLITCPQIPSILTGLGTPGTEQWCGAISAIIDTLGGIGNQLFVFIDDLLNTKTRLENIDEYLTTTNDSAVVTNIVRMIRQVFCWIGPYIETVRGGIACIRQWLSSLFPKCNTSALFGLSIIRLVLVTFERIEWGSDAAVWLVASSGVSITPLTSTIEYLIAYSCPQELIGVSEIIEAYKYNNLDESVAKCLLQAHGLQWDTVFPAIVARGDKPGWREAIEYVRRNNLPEGSEDATLRNLGVIDPSYRDLLRTVYDELPTISDHLHFLQRNVHDDAYVRDFRLMEGFDDKFWTKFGPQLRALGMTKEIAGLHYAAHWINPAFGQLFSMVQRLRVGRVDNSLVFTRNDLLRVMAEMDVAPYFREKLEAISHPIPSLTVVLQMYQLGQIDDAQIVEMLKDLGYEQSYADAIASTQRVKVRRLNASSGHGWTPTAMASAYAVGRLTEQQVRDEMTYLGYSVSDSDRLLRRAEIELAIAPVRRIQQQSIRSALTTQESAYKCGAISSEQLIGVYENAGIPNKIAQIATANVDSEIAVALCNQQVQAFKRALLTGKANLDQIRGIMQTVGIPLLRIEQYLKAWVIEAQLKAPQATAAQILRWVGMGMLDSQVAAQRLLNLGWADPDLTLLLAESAAKLQRQALRAQQLASKSQQAAATQSLKLARAAEGQAKSLRSQLRGIAPMGTLRKWYKQDLLTDPEFLEYATARGYPPKEAEKYLAEAQLEKAKASAPPKSKSKPKASGNGTATGSTGQAPPAAPSA